MEKPRHIWSHAGLRGVAALLVMAYHLQFANNLLPWEAATPLFRRGYLFVDLFFILSGFIISYTNDGERTTPIGARAYREFMLRRLIRLYPLLAFTLVYLVIGEMLLAAALRSAGRPAPDLWSGDSVLILAAQATMLNAWLPDPNAWNVPSWSISAEMFAYLMFPVLVSIHAARPKAALIALLAIAAAFYGAIAATTGSLDIIGGLAPLRCLAGFALGMIVFYGRRWIAAWPGMLRDAIQILCVAAIVALLAQWINDVLLIPAFLLLVAATWTDQGPVARALSARPFQFLGDISYSVYLNHVCVRALIDRPLQVAFNAAGIDGAAARIGLILIYAAAVIIGSWATFRYVEIPARSYLSRRLLGHAPRPIGLAAPAP